MRGPKYKTFNHKKYFRIEPGPQKKKATLTKWANWERKVNKRPCRVVKAPKGGYEGYMGKGTIRTRK